MTPESWGRQLAGHTPGLGDLGDAHTQNARGQWVPSIPLPLYGLIRRRCQCGKRFWTTRRYRAHYALDHILYPPEAPHGSRATDTGRGGPRLR